MKKILSCILFLAALFFSVNVYPVPRLNSLPSASATIFLDFDGHYVTASVWNGGNPIDCVASTLSENQIIDVFNRVSEDFRPFNINITTDSVKFLAAPLNRRVRIIITSTSAWYPGVGGAAYLGSFIWGNDTPGFVFENRLPVGGPIRTKMIAECCSHESGHTLNLSHQSKYDSSCNLLETYSTGSGTGECAWSPIMGNSYHKNMTGWNNGSIPMGCSATEDNLSIITTQNGFTYRPDDYTALLNASTFTLTPPSFYVQGIISTSTDKDAFKFHLSQNANILLNAQPFNVGANNEAANLDIKLSLYNASGSLIRSYNPETAMNATVDTILKSGTYYIRIEGTGNENTSSYGSLGSYTFWANNAPLPIHNLTLKGRIDKDDHKLNWTVITDEAIRSIIVEVSTDGSNFNILTTVDPTARSFSYQPYSNDLLYYRLKAISVTNQTKYSNTIVLKASGRSDNPFIVSTLVQHEISVNASESFQYRISDAHGRLISSGKGTKGLNRINLHNQPGGSYFFSIFTNKLVQTERFIKL